MELYNKMIDVWLFLQPRSDSDKTECAVGEVCQCPCYAPTDYNYCSGHFTVTESVMASNRVSGVTVISAPAANIRYRLTVLIHNSGHFEPPLPFWARGPPAVDG